MALEPEEMSLVRLMAGLKVVMEYERGPQLTEENMDRVMDEGEALTGQPETRTAALYLEAFSKYGVEVSEELGSSRPFFMPWSAIKAIHPMRSREDLIELEREYRAREQDAGAREGNPPPS